MSNGPMPEKVLLGPEPLTAAQVVDVVRGHAPVGLSDAAEKNLAATRLHIENLAHAVTPTYGVSTGFGALATRHIPVESRTALQRSLIRSHAAGAGPAVETEVVRGLMLLRLRTLASGYTGVRPGTAQTLAALLNAGITPIVHEYGSLGCSGDLAPLAAVALALMGEGEVEYRGAVMKPAEEALKHAGIEPVVLAEKEGLALTNGTDGMLGMLLLAAADLHRLFDIADLTAAMSVEALLGTDRAFAADLQALRPHPGQAKSAARMWQGAAGLEDRREPPRPGLQPRPGRLLAALRPAGPRRRARQPHPRRTRRRPRARVRCGQSRRPRRRPRRVQRQLPRRARRVRAGLPRHPDRRRRQHRRAPHRPDARQGAFARPAAVPRRRPRGRLRPHDRPVHAGRDRQRAQAARGARRRSTRSRAAPCRRTTSPWAGRPRASCARPSTA